MIVAQGDLSSNAPSVESVNSVSQYSMDDGCSDYQGDLSAYNVPSVESVISEDSTRLLRVSTPFDLPNMMLNAYWGSIWARN